MQSTTDKSLETLSFMTMTGLKSENYMVCLTFFPLTSQNVTHCEPFQTMNQIFKKPCWFSKIIIFQTFLDLEIALSLTFVALKQHLCFIETTSVCHHRWKSVGHAHHKHTAQHTGIPNCNQISSSVDHWWMVFGNVINTWTVSMFTRVLVVNKTRDLTSHNYTMEIQHSSVVNKQHLISRGRIKVHLFYK